MSKASKLFLFLTASILLYISACKGRGGSKSDAEIIEELEVTVIDDLVKESKVTVWTTPNREEGTMIAEGTTNTDGKVDIDLEGKEITEGTKLYIFTEGGENADNGQVAGSMCDIVTAGTGEKNEDGEEQVEITPLKTLVAQQVINEGVDEDTAKKKLAERLNTDVATVTANPKENSSTLTETKKVLGANRLNSVARTGVKYNLCFITFGHGDIGATTISSLTDLEKLFNTASFTLGEDSAGIVDGKAEGFSASIDFNHDKTKTSATGDLCIVGPIITFKFTNSGGDKLLCYGRIGTAGAFAGQSLLKLSGSATDASLYKRGFVTGYIAPADLTEAEAKETKELLQSFYDGVDTVFGWVKQFFGSDDPDTSFTNEGVPSAGAGKMGVSLTSAGLSYSVTPDDIRYNDTSDLSKGITIESAGAPITGTFTQIDPCGDNTKRIFAFKDSSDPTNPVYFYMIAGSGLGAGLFTNSGATIKEIAVCTITPKNELIAGLVSGKTYTARVNVVGSFLSTLDISTALTTLTNVAGRTVTVNDSTKVVETEFNIDLGEILIKAANLFYFLRYDGNDFATAPTGPGSTTYDYCRVIELKTIGTENNILAGNGFQIFGGTDPTTGRANKEIPAQMLIELREQNSSPLEKKATKRFILYPQGVPEPNDTIFDFAKGEITFDTAAGTAEVTISEISGDASGLTKGTVKATTLSRNPSGSGLLLCTFTLGLRVDLLLHQDVDPAIFLVSNGTDVQNFGTGFVVD